MRIEGNLRLLACRVSGAAAPTNVVILRLEPQL